MRLISAVAMATALVACGGGGSGSGSSGGGAAVTQTPPTPPSPPPPTYRRFAELTGNRNLPTACGAFSLGTGSPPPLRPATGFSAGLQVGYTSADDTYTVSGDAAIPPRTFGPTNLDPAAPAGSLRYAKANSAGFTERFSIPTPAVAGVSLEYARAVSLTVGLPIVQYLCVTGVPTVVGDTPAGSNIPFARVGFNGTAYRFEGGVQRVYSLAPSIATLAANLTTGTVTITLSLIGIEQTPTGPVGGNVPLGDFTGTAQIDTAVPSYYGSIQPSVPGGSIGASGNFGGWFFGPQGAEAASVVTLVTTEPTRQTTVLGNLVAFQR